MPHHTNISATQKHSLRWHQGEYGERRGSVDSAAGGVAVPASKRP
jgi:hypothetical protein